MAPWAPTEPGSGVGGASGDHGGASCCSPRGAPASCSRLCPGLWLLLVYGSLSSCSVRHVTRILGTELQC